MLPHQIYQALTDERTRELMEEARRHELMTAARHAPAVRQTRADVSESSFTLRSAAGRLLALLLIRDAHARSTAASATGAGPMGSAA